LSAVKLADDTLYPASSKIEIKIVKKLDGSTVASHEETVAEPEEV